MAASDFKRKEPHLPRFANQYSSRTAFSPAGGADPFFLDVLGLLDGCKSTQED